MDGYLNPLLPDFIGAQKPVWLLGRPPCFHGAAWHSIQAAAQARKSKTLEMTSIASVATLLNRIAFAQRCMCQDLVANMSLARFM